MALKPRFDPYAGGCIGDLPPIKFYVCGKCEQTFPVAIFKDTPADSKKEPMPNIQGFFYHYENCGLYYVDG